MNIVHFNSLLNRYSTFQQHQEWQLFLEFIETYFRNRDIMNPIIVELGTARNRQRMFYKSLMGAEHIGIDISGQPDILGNTHNKTTLDKLKFMLRGRPINLLFIDACHDYQDVKHDYEMYAPLTKNIIAFHDIKLQREEVRIFWNEIIAIEKDKIKLMIYVWNAPQKITMGIGLLIKET